MHEPIANSKWKLDKYVDFDATLDPSYKANDETKELNEKFTLLEKIRFLPSVSVSTTSGLKLCSISTLIVRAGLSSYREFINDMSGPRRRLPDTTVILRRGTLVSGIVLIAARMFSLSCCYLNCCPIPPLMYETGIQYPA